MAKKKPNDWRVDLGNGLWYDNTPDYLNLEHSNIRSVEQSRQCRYVCEWPLLNDGNKPTETMLLFWNDVAHPQGSNWMALFFHDGGWYVRDGISASRHPIHCPVSQDGQVMLSKHRHDYRTSKDGSIAIDGGRDYTKTVGTAREWVWLMPQQGMLTILDESAATILRSGMDKSHKLVLGEYTYDL